MSEKNDTNASAKHLNDFDKKEKSVRVRVASGVKSTAERFSSDASYDSFTFDEVPPDQNVGPATGQIYYREGHEYYSSPHQFLAFLFGFAFDTTTLSRFPYLCFRYKAVFFIPFILSLIFLAFPILLLELLVGQYTLEGAIGMWKLCPGFIGCGISILLVTYAYTFAYNALMAWTVQYTIKSWQTPLPWSTCDNPWNSENCIDSSFALEQTMRNETFAGTEYYKNIVEPEDLLYDEQEKPTVFGPPILKHYMYLTACYAILIIFLLSGLKSSSKLMWFSTILPILLLLVLGFRAITLPGSLDAFLFLFSDARHLWNYKMWVDAMEQALYSNGLGFGVHVTFASLNNFHHNVFRDAVIVVSVNAVTNILALIVGFGFIGSEAFLLRKSIELTLFPDKTVKVPRREFVFEVCADAIGRLPSPNFFAFLFYLTVLILSFSCILGANLTMLISLRNELRRWNIYSTRKIYVIASLVFLGLNFSIGMLSLTKGHGSLYRFVHDNLPSLPYVLSSLWFNVGVVWFYGLDSICLASYAMLSRIPPMWIRICWKYICPLCFMLLFVGSCFMNPLDQIRHVSKYFNTPRTYTGALLAWFPMFAAVFVTFVVVYKIKGPMKWLCLISPSLEHDSIRRTRSGKRMKRFHWAFIGTKEQMEQIVHEFHNLATEDISEHYADDDSTGAVVDKKAI